MRLQATLIVLKPVTATAAPGPPRSDAPAGRRNRTARPAGSARWAAPALPEAARQAQGQRAKGQKCIKDAAPNVPVRDVKVSQASLQATNNVDSMGQGQPQPHILTPDFGRGIYPHSGTQHYISFNSTNQG